MPIPEKVPAGSFAACFPKEATTVEDFHDLVARLTIYYDQERVRCQELEDENALLHRFVQELKEGQQAASKEINKPLQGVPFDQTLSGSSNYRYSTLSGSFQGQTLEESRALTDDAQEHDFRGMELRGIFVFFPSFLGGFDDNNSVYIYLFVHMSYILVYICIYIYIVICMSIVKIFLSRPGPQARVEGSQPVILALMFGAQCGLLWVKVWHFACVGFRRVEILPA